MKDFLIYFFISIAIVAVLALIIVLLYKTKPISKYYKARIKRLTIKQITIKYIDKMEGHVFEEYLYDLFNELGYKVALLKQSKDFGADLLFNDRNGDLAVIQAKRYNKNKKVESSAVQAVYTSKRYYFAKNAYVITNSNYTKECDDLAGYARVKLLTRRDLQEIIGALQSNQYSKAREIIESEPRQLYDNVSYKKIEKDNGIQLP